MGKNIKDYIEFAIENGYRLKESNIRLSTEYRLHNGETIPYLLSDSSSQNITDLITSKEFIESIARGITGLPNEWWNEIRHYTLKDAVTELQGIAIRDGKLDAFIKKILP